MSLIAARYARMRVAVPSVKMIIADKKSLVFVLFANENKPDIDIPTISLSFWGICCMEVQIAPDLSF